MPPTARARTAYPSPPTPEDFQAAIEALANRAAKALRGGPNTPEGKERSSQNSFKHGLAQSSFRGLQLLPTESPAEWAQLVAEVRAQFRPITPAEVNKIDDMAHAWFLQHRARNLQTKALIDEDYAAFALFIRYEREQRRAYQMAHKDFEAMKKARLDAPPDRQRRIQPGIFQSDPVFSSPEPESADDSAGTAPPPDPEVPLEKPSAA